jgi:citrate lyase subunit beta/citryl-CoA lyase
MPDIFRSLLFVPGNRERMLARAPSAGADAIVVDLEDAIPPAEKRDARKLLRAELPRLIESAPAVFVRVNDVHSRLTRDDLFAVVRPGLRGVVHPKTAHPQDLRDLDVLLREAEVKNGVRPGDIATIPLIESPAGVLRCEAIADATDRPIALSVGGEDYATELGVPRDAGATAIAHLRYTVVTVAAARGLLAIDTPHTDFKDASGLQAETMRARNMGFKGKYAIHPDQIATINRLMTPSREEVAYARRVVATAEAAAAKRRGATSIDGRMIDAPVVERARAIIALSKRKSEREGA